MSKILVSLAIVVLALAAVLVFKGNKSEEVGHSFNFDRVERAVSVGGKYELLLGIKRYDVKVAYILMSNDGKRLYDVMQVDNGRYDAPVEHTIKTQNGDYLVVRKLDTSGTGMIQYNDVWYEIREDSYTGVSFNKVLEYPAEGHNDGTLEDNDLVLKTNALVVNNGAGIEVDYTLETYANKDNRGQLVKTENKKVFFVWNDDKKEFVFDAKKSEMTEGAMLDILGLSKLWGPE